MKRIGCTVLALLILCPSVSEAGFAKRRLVDAVALTTAGVTGYYGVKLLRASRSDYASWNRERDFLLYNTTLTNLEWIKRYDRREKLEEQANIKFIYGLSLLALSGTIGYTWAKYRLLVQPRTHDLGANVIIKF